MDTFFHLFIWSLTMIAFVYYVFFGGDLVVVRTSEHLPPLPSPFYSIILTVVAFGTFLIVILRYTARKDRRYPPPKAFLIAFGVFGGGLDRLTPRTAFFPRLKKFFGVIALIVGIYLLAGVLFSQGLILPAAAHWLPVSGGTATAQTQLISWETTLEHGFE